MDKGKQKTLYSHLAGLYGVNELKILFLSLCCQLVSSTLLAVKHRVNFPFLLLMWVWS